MQNRLSVKVPDGATAGNFYLIMPNKQGKIIMRAVKAI